MLSLVYRSPIRRTLLVSAIRYNSSVPAKARPRFGSHILVGLTGAVFGAGAAGLSLFYLFIYLFTECGLFKVTHGITSLEPGR